MATNIITTAIGALFLSKKTRRCLYLLRSERQRNTWGLVGGKQENGESTLDCLHRECTQEIGNVPNYIKLVPLETFTSEDRHFQYITFVCIVDDEFVPRLNHEHHGYCWVSLGEFPRPLHPGLWNTVNYSAVRDKIQVLVQGLDYDASVND